MSWSPHGDNLTMTPEASDELAAAGALALGPTGGVLGAGFGGGELGCKAA
jgi:hypothetical protein